MKMTSSIELNLKTEEAMKQVIEACKLAMRDTVVEVTGDAVKGSPWETGNNRRSIVGDASGMGKVAGQGGSERLVDDTKIEGAAYSTSGYGGILETGSVKMNPRPYFKPALDKNFSAEKFASKVKEHLK